MASHQALDSPTSSSNPSATSTSAAYTNSSVSFVPEPAPADDSNDSQQGQPTRCGCQPGHSRVILLCTFYLLISSALFLIYNANVVTADAMYTPTFQYNNTVTTNHTTNDYLNTTVTSAYHLYFSNVSRSQ